MARIAVIIDAKTGKETTRPFTAAEEAAANALEENPEPPPFVTRRQLFQALVDQDELTQADVRGMFMGGAMPVRVRSFINSLPGQRQFGAELILTGETNMRRDNAVVVEFLKSLGLTDRDIDVVFLAASQL